MTAALSCCEFPEDHEQISMLPSERMASDEVGETGRAAELHGLSRHIDHARRLWQIESTFRHLTFPSI
jgi:hypothetical protein